jgi:hypothetical protein
MKLICAPAKEKYPGMEFDLRVDLFSKSGFKTRGHAGSLIAERIRRTKLNPSQRTWDLLSLALAIVAADHAHHRDKSSDGWTRQIDIAVAVNDPDFWNTQSALIQSLLGYLTTDVWRVEFVSGGFVPEPHTSPPPSHEDCVVLLSGGLDSLIGAIDLTAGGHTPLAVSHIVRGDSEKQVIFAKRLPPEGLRLIQLNHNVTVPNPESPPSQRSRSLAFLAYGVLAATTLDRYATSSKSSPITLFVCENGFIGINPPLTASRIGSLSTRTTHPVVLSLFQDLLSAAGLTVELANPYRLKTKGEMLSACANPALLDELASTSTSCGRFKQFGYKHCGRCVPCLIRRAAFLRAGRPDKTKYKYENLSINSPQRMRFDDVRSAKMAVEQARKLGVERWLGATFASQRITQAPALRDMIKRGLAELEALLAQHGVK